MSLSNCNERGPYIPELDKCDDCSALTDRLNALETAVDSLQTVLSSTNDNVAELQTAMTSTSERVADLRSAITETQNNVADLQTSMSAMTRRIAVLETLIGNKQDTVLSMTDENNNATTVTILAE